MNKGMSVTVEVNINPNIAVFYAIANENRALEHAQILPQAGFVYNLFTRSNTLDNSDCNIVSNVIE